MRWLDIDLRDEKRVQSAAPHLARAAQRYQRLAQIQADEGCDSPHVHRQMVEIGQLLFRAVTAAEPQAFSRERHRDSSLDPEVGIAETDHTLGYHLAVSPEHLSLPWTWLHSGFGFLLERFAITSSLHRSRPAPAVAPGWLGRLQDTLIAQSARGARTLAQIVAELRPAGSAAPEILFLAGHCDHEVRPLLYREADAIHRALSTAVPGRPLVRLQFPERPLPPGQLQRRGGAFQGFHFAGPTARPARTRDESGWDALLSAQTGKQDPGGLADADLFDDAGDWELVGIDPITAVLDEVSARAKRRHETSPGAACVGQPDKTDGARDQRSSAGRGGASVCWLLEDGPLDPEGLSRGGGMPPLVFSNSYYALPLLGPRFLQAGASTFIGPVAALLSHPARDFAASVYSCLADGYCAGAALRTAALSCRERLGEEHPAWLSYGLVGYGSLALQYL